MSGELQEIQGRGWQRMFNSARRRVKKPLHAWISSLQDKPILVILQEVEYELGHGNSPQAAETKWIKRFRRTVLNANLRDNAARIWDRLTNSAENEG